MASLQDLLSARLENVKTVAGGGWVAACPICRAQGHDSTRSHLRVYSDAAFSCAKHQGDTAHNRAIRAFIYEGADSATLAALDLTIIDPEPKLSADKVYPESMLQDMLHDYSYWIGRGISEDVLRRLEGRLHPPGVKSKMSGRFLFPIRDHVTGKIVGWTGRLVDEARLGPTHKHLVKTSRAVYPLWYTKEAILKARKVVFVESMGDMLALASHGIECVIVLMGLNINSRMLGFLVGANLDQVIISTNNDAIGKPESDSAGNKAAAAIRAKLVPFLGEERVRIRLPASRKDWGDVLRDGTGEIAVFKAELEGKAPSNG